MKKCIKCKKSFSDNVNYCNICGEKLSYDTNSLKFSSQKSIFEEKIKAEPLNQNIISEYIDFLIENNLLNDALEYAYKAIAINEENEKAQLQLIKCLHGINELEEAYEVSKKAYSKFPDNIDIITEFATLNKKIGNYEKAIELCDNVLEKEPRNISAIKEKAMIITELGSYDSVLDLWSEVFNSDSKNIHAQLFKAISEYNNENYTEAESILETVFAKFEPDTIYRLLASIVLAKVNIGLKKEVEYIKQQYEELLQNSKIDILDEKSKKWIVDIAVFLAHIEIENNKWHNAIYIAENIDSLGYVEKANFIRSSAYLRAGEYDYTSGNIVQKIDNIEKGLEYSEKNSEIEAKLLAQLELLKEKKRRKSKRKIVITLSSVGVIIIIIIISVISNIINERKAWDRATEKNSILSYRDYMHFYPEGRYIEQAEQNYEKLIWEKAKETNSIGYLTRYIEEFPEGKFYDAAVKSIELAYFEKASSIETDEGFLNYIKKYPDGKYAYKAADSLKNHFVDLRDNCIYRIVNIGNQTWFAENLSYNTLGSKIGKYGYYYDWETAKLACPTGWRLPSDNDWAILIKFVGASKAGERLKSRRGWDRNGNGTDIYGFSAFPAGYRDGTHGKQWYVGLHGSFWSSTGASVSQAWERTISFNRSDIRRRNSPKTAGFSVRCIKE